MAYIGQTPSAVPLDGDDIADDIVDSQHYAAGSIDTAHLADDQITLAKMAAGTDGNIISYDASGNPVAIATGSNGQVLTSTGAGSPPAFEALPAAGFRVGARAYRSSNQTISTGTSTQIQFNAESWDPNGDFDSSTGYDYVVPTGEGGKYLVTASLDQGVNVDQTFCRLYITVNGGAAALSYLKTSGTSEQSSQASDIIDLSAADSVEIFFHHAAGSNKLVYAGETGSYFSIQRIA